MALKLPERDEPDVNLTPLIDVVFLLLIFFMVSTTFDKDSAIQIELPEASGKPAQAKPQTIDIEIDAKGKYYINQQAVINTQLETLKRAIKKVAGDQKNPPLVISADGKTPHQSVIRAMDAARQLGFVHLTFATKLPEEK